MAEQADLYDDYVAFKGWDAEATGGAESHAALLAFAGMRPGHRLLDIGFGRGDLLDWAKTQGVETHGVELIPELVTRAKARGHLAVAGELDQFSTGSFDVITAIDVLEHLTLEQLRAMLVEVRRLLTPDGVFIARFPNGQSPFSGAHQHGDLTHVRYLTPGAVRQVAQGAGLTLSGAYNLRPKPKGLNGLKHRAAFLVRDLVETVIGYAYFGHRFPMDPNVVVVLRRPPGAASANLP